MKPEEKQNVIDRYADRVRRIGPSVEALGWRDTAQQELRFEVLVSGCRIKKGDSVLDIGCGFGDLAGYFARTGFDVRYTGSDISPDVLGIARNRYPGLEFEERDVLLNPYESESFDHVLISGIFNFKLADNMSFLNDMLAAASRFSRTAVGANMMTDQVDFRDDKLFYYSPEQVLKFCRGLSRSVALRQDYPLYEFSVFIYRSPASRRGADSPEITD